jgi:hypothetical protein
VSTRGLTTSLIPYRAGIFEIEFDLIDHELVIETSLEDVKSLRLAPRFVTDFYENLMEILGSIGIHPKIWTMPCELPDPIRLDSFSIVDVKPVSDGHVNISLLPIHRGGRGALAGVRAIHAKRRPQQIRDCLCRQPCRTEGASSFGP